MKNGCRAVGHDPDTRGVCKWCGERVTFNAMGFTWRDIVANWWGDWWPIFFGMAFAAVLIAPVAIPILLDD